MASPADDPGSPSETNDGSGWPEPPWSGWIETTGDALLILEAARRGLIPRVTRRLVDSERKMITSGSVFVFDEDESGIKRWTDGFVWSPSRILGNFLLYRETDKRGPNRAKGETDTSEEASAAKKGKPNMAQALTYGLDKHRERLLLGSLTNSHKFKVDGMIKKTFSLTIAGVSQHLISYYKVADVESGRLRSPSSLPELATLEISPEYLDKVHFRQPPRVEIGLDGIPRYRGEADDPDAPSPISATPRTTTDKTSRRYDPYAPSSPKKGKKARSQRTASQSETEVVSYTTPPSEAYNYAQYPPYGYNTAYPYMQYPMTSGAQVEGDGHVPAGAYAYGMGGYYWPGYAAPQGMIENPEEDEEGGEEKAEGERSAVV